MLEDAKTKEVVVVGNVLICSLTTYVLFDMGSFHIFVSTQFAKKFNKEYKSLVYELTVSQPMNKGIICSIVYRDYDIYIEDTVMPIDLIPLEIGYFMSYLE